MGNAEATEETVDKKEETVDKQEIVDKKKAKRDKVRSAWISFAGRIVAQIVGAIATVALGVMVLHRYTSNETRPASHQGNNDVYAQPAHPNAPAALGTAPAASGAPASQPPVHVIVITPAMLGWRDADERSWPTDRGCAPGLDSPPTSAARFNDEALLSR